MERSLTASEAFQTSVSCTLTLTLMTLSYLKVYHLLGRRKITPSLGRCRIPLETSRCCENCTAFRPAEKPLFSSPNFYLDIPLNTNHSDPCLSHFSSNCFKLLDSFTDTSILYDLFY